MLRQNNKFIRRIQLSGDLAFTALSFLIAYELRDRLLPVHLKPISEYLFLMYVVIPVWWFLLVYNGSYRSIRVKTLAQALTPVVKTVFAGGLILMAAAIYIPGLQALFDTAALPVSWVFGIVLVGVLNIVLIEIAKWMFRRFKNK